MERWWKRICNNNSNLLHYTGSTTRKPWFVLTCWVGVTEPRLSCVMFTEIGCTAHHCLQTANPETHRTYLSLDDYCACSWYFAFIGFGFNNQCFSTGVSLILGSKVQCLFCFETYATEGRGREEGGSENFKTEHTEPLPQEIPQPLYKMDGHRSDCLKQLAAEMRLRYSSLC